jgi:hypothetical protein
MKQLCYYRPQLHGFFTGGNSRHLGCRCRRRHRTAVGHSTTVTMTTTSRAAHSPSQEPRRRPERDVALPHECTGQETASDHRSWTDPTIRTSVSDTAPGNPRSWTMATNQPADRSVGDARMDASTAGRGAVVGSGPHSVCEAW